MNTLRFLIECYDFLGIPPKRAMHYIAGDRMNAKNARGHGNRARRRIQLKGGSAE